MLNYRGLTSWLGTTLNYISLVLPSISLKLFPALLIRYSPWSGGIRATLETDVRLSTHTTSAQADVSFCSFERKSEKTFRYHADRGSKRHWTILAVVSGRCHIICHLPCVLNSHSTAAKHQKSEISSNLGCLAVNMNYLCPKLFFEMPADDHVSKLRGCNHVVVLERSPHRSAAFLS